MKVFLIRSSIYEIAVTYKLVFFLQLIITYLSHLILWEKHLDLIPRKIIISTIVMRIEYISNIRLIKAVKSWEKVAMKIDKYLPYGY